MKAISLWQPWASAIALGFKRIETRHWATAYRGPIAIHAAKRWTAEEREFFADQQEDGFFDPGFVLPMPLGALVAVCRLVEIRRTEKLTDISRLEQSWGNYGDGRFGWLFEDIRALPEPIPCRGHQSIFDVPEDVLPVEYRPPVGERLL